VQTIIQKMVQKCEELYKRVEELGITHKKLSPLVMGRDIVKFGLQPSPNFSKILNEAYEAQMHGKFINYSDAILWLRAYLKL